ncbi:MAG: hypothetical protein KAR05_10765 [Candidatus Omnitrophica bacterium]|nr:hypothetical protein [Candidatus Omnitrophota bacterium]
MNKILKKLFLGHKTNKFLRAYMAEVSQNLEKWHVIYQLRRLLPLQETAIKRRRQMGILAVDLILQYEEFVLSYQDRFEQFVDFREHYQLSLDHLSRESARQLHEKRTMAFESLVDARDCLERIQVYLKEMTSDRIYGDKLLCK